MEEIFHLGGRPDTVNYFHKEEDGAIIVDAVKEALDDVTDFVEKILRASHCTMKIMNDVRLVVEEIFINICSYAYTPNIGRAEVRCWIEQGSVFLQFTDSGVPFDPLARPEVDTSGKMFLEKVGGFGIHLVKKIMDEVSYKYQNGQNVLCMREGIRK